ncbi:MAG: hypothetical protein J5I93_14245 [Pirellulaceae bacterium]|nr:hypothetical protein [Pirellulaceae bacterium]
MRLIEIRCPGCGAPIQHAPGRAIARCPFCDNTLAMVQEDERGRAVEFNTNDCWIAPFAVTKADFERTLLEWLTAGDYTPDDVLEGALVRDHVGIYAPFYAFTGFYTANWTAAAGFDRTESYVDTNRTFRDGKWVDEPVARTRTVTDWRPISGEVHGEFHIFCCASRQMPAEMLDFCEQASRDVLLDMSLEDGLQGFLVEALTIDPDACFRVRGRPQLDTIIRRDIQSRIPGDRSRDERWDSQLRELKPTKVYLPFWLASCTYRERLFHFIVDGRDTARCHGQRPVDEQRKKRIDDLYKTAKIWGIVWLVIGLVGVFLVFIPTLLALIIGLPGYLYLNSQANKQKEEILSESRALRQQALQAIQARGGLHLDSGNQDSFSD